MRQDSPAKALAWMATGAAVLAAGAVLGSAAGRRKDRGRRRKEHAGLVADPLEDLADRPVARAVLAESVAAARRVETLADSVAGLEARVQAAERAAAAKAQAAAAQSAERIEAIWRRVVQIEGRLEQIRAERAEMPSLHTIVAQAESRLSPRIHVLETRVEEHHAVIEQLREQASQTEANLQKMIAAVEKLADQVARVLPPQAPRIEPKRESAAAPVGSAAGGAAGEGAQPGAAARAADPPGEERGTPFRWKSLALVAAIALSLGGSWVTVRKEAPWFHAAAATSHSAADSAAPEQIDAQIDAAILSLTALARRQPLEREWKYELGRLCSMKGDWSQAERWYRAVLAENPDDPRALNALAEVLSRHGPEAPPESTQ